MFQTLSYNDNCSYGVALANKWKGIFFNGLRAVQRQVHPSLTVKEDALEYVESLMLQLLQLLCSFQPHSTQDVEDRVRRTFPGPINKWAIRDAHTVLDKGRKGPSLFVSMDQFQLLLKEELGYRIDYNVSIYIAAVIEDSAADILKLTGIYVNNIRHLEITSQDIKVSMCTDQVLVDMFMQDEEVTAMMMSEDEPVRRESMTYEEIVKDFIVEETQYLRDLNMIIKVFRAPFADLFPRSKDLDIIFSNILDIYEFTTKLLRSVEEQMEVAQDNENPIVGTCFADLAEDEEFNVYERYVDDMLSPHGKERLNTLLLREDVIDVLEKTGCQFKGAMKYVLPKLLMGPVYRCPNYFELIKALIDASSNDEDRELLKQALGLLQSLKIAIDRRFSGSFAKRKPWEVSLRLHSPRFSRRSQMQMMQEIQRRIDGWEGKDICQTCSEFITDRALSKQVGRKWSERHVFLFDSLIIVCKLNSTNSRRTSGSGSLVEYKFKEKYFIRKVQVVDVEDTDDLKNCFEIIPRDHPAITLSTKASVEEKYMWMSSLTTLQTRSMLERLLDAKLRQEECRHPLRRPSASLYQFAEEDSEGNILFEELTGVTTGGGPLIKGGMLFKLVERLTYHMYADPKFVRTFLLTYRSFCSPKELLALLVERYSIPDPDVRPGGEGDDDSDVRAMEDLNRFRKEYVKPVQFRVVNVLRHWVDHHFYDFERDPSLLESVREFLINIRGKAMRNIARSIIKVIQRKSDSLGVEREFTNQGKPPNIEWHLAHKSEDFDLIAMHPVEIARQVTLLEFEMYRAIKPSELVGSPWMKADKHQTSPNLLKMINFSTTFTFWLEKCILETGNIEERVAVVSRIVEILLVFQELNNFNGVLEVVSALDSAPVYRLDHTFKEVNHKYVRAQEEAQELNADHFRKYNEKLRSVNPPCVPFLGMYLTNILLTEEGNRDFITEQADNFINFSKRRKVAEITGELQQFQNQPYCLQSGPMHKEFFTSLDPLAGMTVNEFNNYLYAMSLEIEPRHCKQPAKFPKKYLDISLKSPGIKLSTHRHMSSGKSYKIPPNISLTKAAESDDPPSPSCATPPTPSCVTPPTPSTPQSTPPFNSSFGSVFNTDSVSVAGSPAHSAPEDSEPIWSQPPPRPPRCHHSESWSSEYGDRVIYRASDRFPPLPPPRLHSSSLVDDVPPPVPPRRESMPIIPCQVPACLQHCSDLHSPACHTARSAVSHGNNTMPRNSSSRNCCLSEASSRVHSCSSSSMCSVLDVNGESGLDSAAPQLPPRTYRPQSGRQSS